MNDGMDFAFVIGPVGPPDMVERIKKVAEEKNKPASEVDAEIMIGTLRNIIERPIGGSSSLEKMLSTLFDKPLRVEEPAITYYQEADGERRPALVLYASKVRNAEGDRMEFRLNSERAEMVANALGYMLKSTWVRSVGIPKPQ